MKVVNQWRMTSRAASTMFAGHSVDIIDALSVTDAEWIGNYRLRRVLEVSRKYLASAEPSGREGV